MNIMHDFEIPHKRYSNKQECVIYITYRSFDNNNII